MAGITASVVNSVAATVRRALHVGMLAVGINALLPFVHAEVMAQSTQAAANRPITIVAFGDSLSAGYQLQGREAFPAQLELALRAKGLNVTVINAGVSGDTTAAGLDRLAWAVPADADAVIVELGANDALRGLDPAKARDNLDQIVATLRRQKQDILIAGMVAPTSLPPDYRRSFDTIFADLATKHEALLYPFFLDGIALDPKLNLADGMHPNAKGVTVIVTRILPQVEALISRVELRRKAKSN